MPCPSLDCAVLKLIEVLVDFPDEDVLSIHTEVYLQILIVLVTIVRLYYLSNFGCQSEFKR